MSGLSKEQQIALYKHILQLPITSGGPSSSVTITDSNIAYDNSLDILKTIEQSPLWSRYTDYETLVTAQDLTTSYADYGSEISTAGYKTLGIFIIGDVNTSEDCDLKILGKYKSGGTDEFELDSTDVKRLWSGVGSDFKKHYLIETDGLPYIQLQAKVGTLGTAGDLTIYVNKVY